MKGEIESKSEILFVQFILSISDRAHREKEREGETERGLVEKDEDRDVLLMR